MQAERFIRAVTGDRQTLEKPICPACLSLCSKFSILSYTSFRFF
ncbi:hypothetical protein Pvag_2554 [Pantoea vagans C9-1]|nr:hypothetical protein Pvag_2554 [Pantoea vagans C9-1]